MTSLNNNIALHQILRSFPPDEQSTGIGIGTKTHSRRPEVGISIRGGTSAPEVSFKLQSPETTQF